MASPNPISMSNLLRLSTSDPLQALANAVVNAPGAVARTVAKPIGEALSNFGPLFGGEAGVATPLQEMGAAFAPKLAPKVAEALPLWAQKLGGLAKPSEDVAKIAKKMKLSDLGDIVPESEFLGRGWIGPDGELIGIGGRLHRDTMLEASGGKTTNYPLVGGHKNIQRIGSYSNYEILSPPTDAQLRQLARFEQIGGREATWDITDPITKNLVATGKGVRNIRAELEKNPKAIEWLNKFVALGAGAGIAAETAKELKEPTPPPRKIGPYASSHYNGQEEF